MTTATPDDGTTPETDRTRLEHVRDVLKERIDAGPGSADLAALSREYRQVLAVLRDLPAPAAASAVDQVARRRAEREAKRAAGE